MASDVVWETAWGMVLDAAWEMASDVVWDVAWGMALDAALDVASVPRQNGDERGERVSCEVCSWGG